MKIPQNRALWIVAIIFSTLIVAAVSIASLCSSTFASEPKSRLREHLRKVLISQDEAINATPVDAIYILGGSQNSLRRKFAVAARLYHDRRTRKVLILHRPGKTEYNHVLGLNMSNDEWAAGRLEALGIAGRDIEAVRLKKGFFGTLAEAKGISALAQKRGYKSLILITAPYHTRRTRMVFEKFLAPRHAKLYVLGSSEKGYLKGLITEWIKLKVYEGWL